MSLFAYPPPWASLNPDGTVASDLAAYSLPSSSSASIPPSTSNTHVQDTYLPPSTSIYTFIKQDPQLEQLEQIYLPEPIISDISPLHLPTPPPTLSTETINYLTDLATHYTRFLWLPTTEQEQEPPDTTLPSFKSFIHHLLLNTQIEAPISIVALWFLKRLREVNWRVSAASGSEYRLFATALLLANKVMDDHRFTNRAWAQVTGISLEELNIMEQEFLQSLSYKLHISSTTYFLWLHSLQSFYCTHLEPRQSNTRTKSNHYEEMVQSPTDSAVSVSPCGAEVVSMPMHTADVVPTPMERAEVVSMGGNADGIVWTQKDVVGKKVQKMRRTGASGSGVGHQTYIGAQMHREKYQYQHQHQQQPPRHHQPQRQLQHPQPRHQSQHRTQDHPQQHQQTALAQQHYQIDIPQSFSYHQPYYPPPAFFPTTTHPHLHYTDPPLINTTIPPHPTLAPNIPPWHVAYLPAYTSTYPYASHQPFGP